MNTNEISDALREARTTRERLFGELANVRARGLADGTDPAGAVGSLNRDLEAADTRILELEAEYGRAAEIQRMAGDQRHREAGSDAPGDDQHRDRGYSVRGGNETRDAALRAIERHESSFEDAAAADRVDNLVRRNEPGNMTARYIAAVGNDHYRSAFGKMVEDPMTGHLKFSPQEVEAVREAAQAERAMNITTGSAGQFALPFTLDPSILLSGAGALNPIRAISRQITVTTNQWKGVSSDGVTTSYVAEATAATDASPTLAQPVITCAQWRAFVPFSIELGQDWDGLDNELVRLVDDGRNTMDATQFYTGTGTNAPQGLLTGLSGTQSVHTTGATAYVVADPWALSAAIPARFRGRTTYAAAPATWDKTFRFVGGGNTTEPFQFGGEDRGGDFLGRPKVEWTAVGTQWTTTGGTIMVAGDFSQYAVVDRLGITAELIPHLFSGNTAGAFGYPVGQRGLYTYGRTGAGVLVQNAFRALVVG